MNIVQKVLEANDKLYHDNWHTAERVDWIMLDAVVIHESYDLCAVCNRDLKKKYPMPVNSGYFVCFQHNVLQCHNTLFIKI